MRQINGLITLIKESVHNLNMGRIRIFLVLVFLFVSTTTAFQNCSSQQGNDFFSASANGDPYEGVDPSPAPGPTIGPGTQPEPAPIPGYDTPLKISSKTLDPLNIPELNVPELPTGEIICVPENSSSSTLPVFFGDTHFFAGSVVDFFTLNSSAGPFNPSTVLGVYQWQYQTPWVNYQIDEFLSDGVFVQSVEFNRIDMTLEILSTRYYQIDLGGTFLQGAQPVITYSTPDNTNAVVEQVTEVFGCILRSSI